MEREHSCPQTDELRPTLALVWLGVKDASAATEGMLDKALLDCAEQMRLNSAEAALELLREGHPLACWYTHHSLGEQVAEVLGALDNTVKSAFLFDVDTTPEDLTFGEPPPTSPIHMIVRAERKTNALYALIRALEGAILDEYANRVGLGRLEYLLDVQLIDGTDIEKRRGYAGLFRSLHNRPIQVWHREQSEGAG